MKLEIVYLDPHDLTPYENNTRKHSPDDIEQIKESIIADGFNDPLGIWGENNLIVEGHGRQIAALEMGLDKVYMGLELLHSLHNQTDLISEKPLNLCEWR